MKKFGPHIYRLINKILPKKDLSTGFSELLMEHISPHLYLDKWSSQPFNGQVLRTRQLCLIAQEFNPDLAIETGTFIGSSTIFLSGLVKERVYTIEINDQYLRKAHKRFDTTKLKDRISIFHGDSSTKIEEILLSLQSNEKRIIAYLDAHWESHVPTTRELEALIRWGDNWIAVIDDFEISFDSGYGFDKYLETVINSDIVPNSTSLQLWVPSQPSELETGARRGTCYVFTDKSVKELNFSLTNLIRIR